MEYETFDHPADVGVRGYGSSLEEAYENGAKAMFQVMTNIKKVKPRKKIKVQAKGKDIEELFVEWLNELLAQADLKNMFFSEFEVKIEKNKEYKLEGYALGEARNKRRYEFKTVVKAATYSQLKVEKTNKRFVAQCICDI